MNAKGIREREWVDELLKTYLLSIPEQIRPVVVLNENFTKESSVTLIDSVRCFVRLLFRSFHHRRMICNVHSIQERI